MSKLQNFIGGEFSAPASGKYLASPNPATEDVNVEVPLSGAADVAKAVAVAKAAFPTWSALRAEERARFLDLIADGIDRRKEELADAESRDQGKPRSLAMSLEIPRAAYNFRFFAGIIRHELSVSAPINSGTFSYVRREPIGVAGLISPWNLPLYLLTWKIAPAIAYGNACVAKPSEMTSHTAALLGEIIREAGLPKGVVNIIFGLGSEAGQALVEHPDVRVVSFTGGTVTGRKIAETAATQLKKVSLELGGKNPTLVFADADVKTHLPTIVRSAFQNQGEICLCGSRIYVEASIYESFVRDFVSAARELVVGDPGAKDTFMGPMISREHREKVASFVAEAVREGWELHTGGKVPSHLNKGFYFEPTVLTPKGRTLAEKLRAGAECRTSRIQQEEVFGPVVTIVPFETAHGGILDEAIDHANGTRYGLAAMVWTQSLTTAHAVAARLHAGTVWVNGWMSRDLRMPFGGVKQSGQGREGQLDSVHVFTEPKTVCVHY